MSKNNKILNWDDFQKLGNPENAPDLSEETDETDEMNLSKQTIRIHLDRIKGNKTVTVIRGLVLSPDNLTNLATDLKKKCGVGGNAKNKEILLQGNHRDKVLALLQDMGAVNIKKAGG